MSRAHSRSIKEEAKRLGFDLVGIARAEVLHPEKERLKKWLAEGYHAGMSWMAREPDRRTDPQAILEGAQTVVSVGLNYYSPVQHSSAPGAARISRYAWGDDYHDIVQKRLRELESCISSLQMGVRTRGYVDTGPVMDKVWAARAGLGWLGKNTNVLTRSHGSWIFLGTILTTLECDPDEPETDMCGTCTACLDACPTDAFPQAYVLDARKCISYLTIEHRGEFKEEQGGELDGWIFGCDVCQDVCPWNTYARPSDLKGFAPREGLADPDLDELSALSQEEFAARFKGSPIKRTKREGLHRNIEVVRESFAK